MITKILEYDITKSLSFSQPPNIPFSCSVLGLGEEIVLLYRRWGTLAWNFPHFFKGSLNQLKYGLVILRELKSLHFLTTSSVEHVEQVRIDILMNIKLWSVQKIKF